MMLCLSGCNDDAVSVISTEAPTTEATTTTQATTTTVTTTVATTTTPEVTTQAFIPDTPTARDYDYEKDLVFLGDSVCMGLRFYSGMLSETQVYAEGSLGARNLLSGEFTILGGKYSAVQAVEARQPKYIYLWMGMNDINMTTEKGYADNLKNISDKLLEVSPYSKVIVVSITPTTDWHEWKANERIDTYNNYTRNYFQNLNDERFSYLDINSFLEDENGNLPDMYQSGDGLHLSPYAYQLVLGYVSANQVGYYGDFPVVTTTFTSQTPPPATTTTTSIVTTVPVSSDEPEPTVAP